MMLRSRHRYTAGARGNATEGMMMRRPRLVRAILLCALVAFAFLTAGAAVRLPPAWSALLWMIVPAIALAFGAWRCWSRRRRCMTTAWRDRTEKDITESESEDEVHEDAFV
jgi:type VI protein secretion system component VasK